MKEKLQELIEEMESVRSQCRGDKSGCYSGYYEDQANVADDIITKAKELIELINELNGTK